MLPAITAHLPREVLGEDYPHMKGLRRATWVSNQLTLNALAAALDALAQHEIHPVVVKGAALVTGVYEEPGIRRMGDADIVVGPDDFDVAYEVLVSRGWRPKGSWIHSVDLVAPTGEGLDLHRWALFPRFCRYEESTWYRRTVPGSVLGRRTSRLRLSDELVLAVVHGLFTHGASSVRWPLDVAAIMRSASPSQVSTELWDEVVSSAREVGLGRVVGQGLSLCVEDLGLEVPQRIVKELEAQPLDLLLRAEWARRRSGRNPQLRTREYVDMQRARGEPSSAVGYVQHRWRALREHGVRRVVQHRTKAMRRRLRR